MSETLANKSALGGTRTPNPLIRSQMLYPLSYERLSPHISGELNVWLRAYFVEGVDGVVNIKPTEL